MLRKVRFHSYILLCCVFKRYINKKRLEKTKNCKKLVIEALYKSVIKDKIRFGLSKTHLNVRKLQKFREWLVLTKNERIRCLKILWKNHLLSVIKIKVESIDNLSIIRSTENYTF